MKPVVAAAPPEIQPGVLTCSCYAPQLVVVEAGGHSVYLCSRARALIEQNWARAVTVFGLRVSVLSVCAAEEATDPCGQTILLSLHPRYVNLIDDT